MIIFKKIRWKNLLSTGNQFIDVQLDKSPTTLVCGDNGAGKTTMLDALTFVLFGKLFRNINITQAVNSINMKDCVVEIEFETNSSNYKITRGLSPKIFLVEKNGTLLDQTASVKDYQQIVEKHILKMNYKTFCQVVILGSTNYIPFMRLTAADRRNIVENLLDIDVFSKMNEGLKIKILETKEELRRIEALIVGLKSKTEYKKDMIQKIEEKSESQFQSYKNQELQEQTTLDGIVSTRTNLQSEIDGLGVGVQAVEKQKESYTTLVGLRKQMIAGIKKAEEESAFYKNHTDCPVCRQGIDAEFRDGMIEKKKDRKTELDLALKTMNEMIEKTQTEIKIASSVLELQRDKVQQVAKLDTASDNSKRYIKQLREFQEKTKREMDSLQIERDLLLQIEREKDIAYLEKKQAVELLHVADIAAVLLKDSGIKRKIIRKYIPALNKIINKYLISMDFFAQFTLNEDFVEIIKSRFRDEFCYDNFSEGEKLRIDLALLLAWRDIAKMKNSANTNLLILDEVFDSSLDAVGTEEVIKILQNMGVTNNIFVISHKSDQLLDKFQNVMVFKKVKNFSKLS